jgi:hypothetical protein
MLEIIEFECPLCGSALSFEPDDSDEGSDEVECDNCNASIEVTYSASEGINATDIACNPSVDAECPECDESVEIDIEEESGSEEFFCENDECGAQFLVEWSDWGQDVNVTLLAEGKRKTDSEISNGRDENDYEDDTLDDDDEDHDEDYDDDEDIDEESEDEDFDW